MRLACIAATVCILGACTDGSPPPAVPVTPESPEPVVIPPPVVTPEPSVPEIQASEIGFSRAPKVSAKARQANRRALKLHRAGDYTAAREGFAGALALSPDHDMARFNLACALARLGEVEASRAELVTLLHRDLLRFAGRWRGPEADPDLEALRTSTHAPELDRLVEGLREAYDAAHDRGIPAYLYARPPVPAQTDFGGNPVTKGSSTLIAGAWLHDARRFVPLARGGTVALLDLPRRRMLRSDVALDEQHCDYAVYASAELVSTDPDPDAEPKGEIREAEGSEDEPDWETPTSVSLCFAGDDVLVDAGPCEGTTMNVTAEGGKYHVGEPEGYVLSGKRLTVPGRADPIELDGKYDHMFATGRAEAPVFVLGRRFEVDYESFDPIFDATVTRVDVTTGTTERIAHGQGDGWVVVGPDGSVYVEIEGKTRRWPTATASEPEDTMPGLHLAMPIGPPQCMCCG